MLETKEIEETPSITSLSFLNLPSGLGSKSVRLKRVGQSLKRNKLFKLLFSQVVTFCFFIALIVTIVVGLVTLKLQTHYCNSLPREPLNQTDC